MEFCDLACIYADWPRDQALDGAGSCRTFQAVYCAKKSRHVHKNMPCPDKEPRKEEAEVIDPPYQGKC